VVRFEKLEFKEVAAMKLLKGRMEGAERIELKGTEEGM